LTDRSQIAASVSQLAMVLDTGHFDDLHSILSEDVTVTTPGGNAAGIAAVISQAAKVHSEFWQRQHILTNLVIDLAQNRATVRANSVATFAPATPAPATPAFTFRIGEVYNFTATRTATGWRLSAISSAPIWKEGTPPPGLAGA
jgi:hypothetical protein